MDAMQKPTHYASTEGGPWEPWPFGYLNTNYLAAHIKDVVDLTVLPIQAVKFEDGTIFDMPIENTSLPKQLGPGKIVETPPDFLVEALKLSDRRKLGDSLNEAHSIINGERQDSYGNPEDSFRYIAEYWTAYMRAQGLFCGSTKVNALDVAHMMMLLKLARCTGQQSKRDNYIDIQGYAAIAADRLVKE